MVIEAGKDLNWVNKNMQVRIVDAGKELESSALKL